MYFFSSTIFPRVPRATWIFLVAWIRSVSKKQKWYLFFCGDWEVSIQVNGKNCILQWYKCLFSTELIKKYHMFANSSQNTENGIKAWQFLIFLVCSRQNIFLESVKQWNSYTIIIEVPVQYKLHKKSSSFAHSSWSTENNIHHDKLYFSG